MTLLHSLNKPDWYEDGRDTEKESQLYTLLLFVWIFGWLQHEIFVCTLLCQKTVILGIRKKDFFREKWENLI